MKKYKEKGTFDDLPKSGRPKKVTTRLQRSIVRTIITNPFASSEEIKKDLPDSSLISSSSIRKIMVNEGYRAYKAKIKPFLTQKHKETRKMFAENFGEKDQEFWQKVIFSDETRISLLASDKPPLVRRPRNSSLDSKFLRPSFKHPVSIMIWGCFSWHGLGEIYIIDGTVNNGKYLEILTNNLMPYIQEKFKNERPIFQDDNAPAHRHRNVKSWMIENELYHLDWPAQSPDLNPIENLWHFLKMKVKKYCPKNKAELISTVKKVWESEIPQELVQNLIKSMLNRLSLLKEANGGHINY